MRVCMNRNRLCSLILGAAMLLSLCACGSVGGATNQENKGEETAGSITVPTNSDTPAAEKSEDSSASNQENKGNVTVPVNSDFPDSNNGTKENGVTTKFVPNKDLRVVAAFSYDNYTNIVVENVGNQAILDFRVAYTAFDKNGFVATRDSDGYELGRSDAANLMPGEKDLASWYGAEGKYVVATVVSVSYRDGSTWEASYLDDWAKSVRTEFDVDAHKTELANLKQFDDLAKSNEYAVLTDYSIKHGNQFSSDHDFHFSIKNTSKQGITKLSVFVLEFDENGFPVSVSPYDTFCLNGHSTGGVVNLAIGESGDYSDNLFISPNTTQIKVVISYIEFQDGTDWTNPYIYEWIIANNSMY